MNVYQSDGISGWRTRPDGTVQSLASNEAGTLFTFTQTPYVPPAAAGDTWADKAREIVQATGVKAGYCLVLGHDVGANGFSTAAHCGRCAKWEY